MNFWIKFQLPWIFAEYHQPLKANLSHKIVFACFSQFSWHSVSRRCCSFRYWKHSKPYVALHQSYAHLYKVENILELTVECLKLALTFVCGNMLNNHYWETKIMQQIYYVVIRVTWLTESYLILQYLNIAIKADKMRNCERFTLCNILVSFKKAFANRLIKLSDSFADFQIFLRA